VIGSHFAEIVGTTRVGRKPAVIATVAGRGWVTDISQYGCDPEDPFPEGYPLRHLAPRHSKCQTGLTSGDLLAGDQTRV
jgi:proline racemase